MSYDEYDAWREAAQSRYDEEVIRDYLANNGYELYREHYDEAVKEFTGERLRSYFLKYPDMARPAIAMMEEAMRLKESFPCAALLYFTSTVEIAVRDLLVKPIVNGLVHTEAVADIVTNLAQM